MKKFTMMVGILALGAGVAFASSVTVPWFLDPGDNDGAYPPAAGQTKTFVTLHNNTTNELTCIISYVEPDGDPNGPDGQNTFSIPASSTVAFRPYGVDPDTGDAEGQAGTPTAVPNANFFAGSGTIQWEGDPSDIQGRIIEIQNGMIYGYLLPPGN